MDNQQIAMILTAMSDQTTAMNRIADAMTGILVHLDPKQAAKFAAPGYMRPLAAYASFDWNSIDGHVITFDRHGATEVEHNGVAYRRYRSNDDDPKGVDIRFRRVVSGTPDGKDMVWATLVKFADKKAKDAPRPLRGELAEKIEHAASFVASNVGAAIPVAIAPTTQIKKLPEPVALSEAQVTAKKLLGYIADNRQSLTIKQSSQSNARGVSLALASNLPAEFIDAHTSPAEEMSGPAMIQHAETLLNAVVAGKALEAA